MQNLVFRKDFSSAFGCGLPRWENIRRLAQASSRSLSAEVVELLDLKTLDDFDWRFNPSAPRNSTASSTTPTSSRSPAAATASKTKPAETKKTRAGNPRNLSNVPRTYPTGPAYLDPTRPGLS